MTTKLPFSGMDVIFRRMAPEFWDSIHKASNIAENIRRSVIPASRFMQENYRAIDPALTESFKSISAIAQNVSSTLAPSLLEFSRISNAINQSVLPAAQQIATMQAKWQTDLQPIWETLKQVIPTETQFLDLARALQEQAESLETVETEDEPEILSSDEEAAANDINEILTNPNNWEQTLDEKIKMARGRHPVYAWLIVTMLSIIIQILVGVLAGLIVETIKPTVIRESPSQTAPIVFNIDASQHFLIINEVPYYYQVEYLESETGDKHTGWVSKRTTKPLALFEEDQ